MLRDAFHALEAQIQQAEDELTEHIVLGVVDSSYMFKLWVASQKIFSPSRDFSPYNSADFEELTHGVQKVLSDIGGCLKEGM
jgi:hypothetical protein